MFRDFAKDKKLTVSTEEVKTIDLLRQLSSAEQLLPQMILKRYAEDFFHEHTLYGILQNVSKMDFTAKIPRKTSVPFSRKTLTKFKLFLYKKPSRNHSEAAEFETVITVDDDGNMHVKDNIDLEKLTLVKITDDLQRIAIDFDRTLSQKKIVYAISKNPYVHDHFIYLSFMNKEKATRCYQGFISNLGNIKKKFGQTNPYTTDFILLNNPASFQESLKKILEENGLPTKLKEGRVYLLIQAHSNVGTDILEGESENGALRLKWSLKQLVDIIKNFGISSDTLLDIDIYACSPGDSDGHKPSFCFRLNMSLKDHFPKVLVKGNTDATFSDPQTILVESPRNVARSGVLREPLSSIEQVYHSDIVYRIVYYPRSEEKKSTRNNVISALQKYTSDLIEHNQKPDQCHSVYIELKNHLEAFEALDVSIQKAIKEFDGLIEQKKIGHSRLCGILRSAFMMVIDDTYKSTIAEFQFTKSLISFKRKFLEFKRRLVLIWQIDYLKTHYAQFFKDSSKTTILPIIQNAEKGKISLDEAWKVISSSAQSMKVDLQPLKINK